MLKKLYFCETNGYNMVVSVDSENNCRYLTETNDFPYIVGMDTDEKEQAAREFLKTVEDDSSWNDDCIYDQIFCDGVDVIAEIEKERAAGVARVKDMKYYVNYGTGAGNEYVDGTLEDAKKVAENGLTYTQEPVKIQTEDGEDVAILPWYGVKPEEDDIVTCQFGDYGFYGEWREE